MNESINKKFERNLVKQELTYALQFYKTYTNKNKNTYSEIILTEALTNSAYACIYFY